MPSDDIWRAVREQQVPWDEVRERRVLTRALAARKRSGLRRGFFDSRAGLERGATQRVAASKVLRIGIIQNGAIVEERIVRKRDTISFGPSEKNTFVLLASDIPSGQLDLFETRGGPYSLNFTDAMQGRVSLDGEVQDLIEVRTSGRARKKGSAYQLQLSESARGKIVIGESTILFQFVAPPPIQPRPQLPAAVRGGIMQRVDWAVAALWIVSFMLHAGIIAWWSTTDWPVVSAWDKYLQLEELVTPEIATWVDKKPSASDGVDDVEPDDVEEGEEQPDEERKPSRPVADQGPKKSAAEIARERAEKRAALAAAITEQGINKILGTLGGEGGGAVADVLRGGDVGADQDDLLAQVSGVGVATSEFAGSLKGPAGGKGSGEVADISQLKLKGGDANVKTAGPGTERKVKGLVKKKKPVASGGTGLMNASDVAKVVNRRLGAIKGCYEQALKRNPTLAGKATIRFTIAASGKVTAASTTLNELTPAVGNCMIAAFKRFRFPPPEGGTVTFSYPFLFTPAGGP